MTGWMTLWTIVFVTAVVGFVLLLLLVSVGAIRELRQTLNELREDAAAAAENPETLDEAI